MGMLFRIVVCYWRSRQIVVNEWDSEWNDGNRGVYFLL